MPTTQTKTAFTAREQSGIAIAKAAKLNSKAGVWVVPSQTSNKAYAVTVDAAGAPHCTCPDHTYRQTECKHILAAAYAAMGVSKRRVVH